MKIRKIHINNFRLLENTSLELVEVLSLIIGKNNSGKTSLLAVLDKFLNGKLFTLEDINLNLQKKIKDAIEAEISVENYTNFQIGLKLEIEYSQEDSLENISKYILDLEATQKTLILSFEFFMDYENYKKLIEDFKKFKTKMPDKDVLFYLIKNLNHYFSIVKKSISYADSSLSTEIQDNDLKKIIGFQLIDAKRNVTNTDDSSSRTLSTLSSKYFKAKSAGSQQGDISDITDLQKQIFVTDSQLTENYKGFFSPVLNNIKKFSSGRSASAIDIHSALQESNLLKDNTIVKYNQDGHNLPENYNGLGYMNLYAMIFDIHIKLDELKKVHHDTARPADINLLFIEEPEAHTHPQMQYIFIKNIKNMLVGETEGKINLQTIITSHSPHIVSQCDFDDLKYFQRSADNSVIVKNLSDLHGSYIKLTEHEATLAEDEKEALLKTKNANFEFLKKYLTLNNAELFFAEKAIFMEGDTERLLLPALIKKFDLTIKPEDNLSPLTSQHISIIEIGNYAQVFDLFLNFLNIKTLIITDIDSCKKKGGTGKDKNYNVTCRVAEGTISSNSSINYFLKGKTFEEIKNLSQKVIKKQDTTYVQDASGTVMITYQKKIGEYHPRSFEDSFIALNLKFVVENKDKFNGLKNREELIETEKDFYKLAENCIDKKSTFACDILFYSDKDFSQWKTPDYISEGLKWLAHP